MDECKSDKMEEQVIIQSVEESPDVFVARAFTAE